MSNATRAYTDPLGLAKDNLRRQREALREIRDDLETAVSLLDTSGLNLPESLEARIVSALDTARLACSPTEGGEK